MKELELSTVIDFLVKFIPVIFTSSWNNLIIVAMNCLTTLMIQEGCDMGRRLKTL